MMGEWIRFILVAALLITALISFAGAVLGAWRFGFVMNRLHAAGIGDTLGIFAVLAACVIAAGFHLDTLKYILIISFMWFTSPVSTHFVGQVEFFTNKEIQKHMMSLPLRLSPLAAAKEAQDAAHSNNTDPGSSAAYANPAETEAQP